MEKKTILVFNILAQVFWYAVAGVATYFVSTTWLSGINQPWKSILGGLVFVGIIFFLSIITNVIKATKDPDVKAASALGMNVMRYKQYQEWYDEHQRLMRTYGIDSKEEQEYFCNFFKQIKNPNEWRRYQKSRETSLVDTYIDFLNKMEKKS